MNYFPDLPWEIGDEFENETTGVVYHYDGTKWIPSSDTDPLVDYLPLTGGTLTGNLNVEGEMSVNDLLDVKGDVVEYQKNRTSILQMGPTEIINAGILDNLMRSPNDGYLKDYLPLTGGELTGQLTIKKNTQVALDIVGDNNQSQIKFWSSGAVALQNYTAFKDNELVTKKYTDDAIKAAVPEVPSPFRQLRFARDKDWNNLRPGEFGLMDKSNNTVAQWSAVSQIFFLGVDTDGNRLIRDENMQSWSSFVGSAVTVLTSSGARPLLRAVPTGQAGGLVMLEWDKEQDLFYIGWSDSKCASLMTGTNDNLSNGQNFLFHIPDLFF